MKPLFNLLVSHDRMTLKLSVVLSFAAGLYIAALQPDILGFYHDDGVYAVTAKALAEGKGYRIISLPEEPVQMLYPIFYPLVLSLVWRMFSDFPSNILALKAPSIIFTLLFLWVTYLYLTRRHYASRRMALAIVFMTAVNPWTVWAATMAMSEALYSLVSLLGLWTTEMFISSTWGLKRRRFIYLILAGMAISVTIMTRYIGISVLSATFIYLFLNKRRGHADRRQGSGIRDQGAEIRGQGSGDSQQIQTAGLTTLQRQWTEDANTDTGQKCLKLEVPKVPKSKETAIKVIIDTDTNSISTVMSSRRESSGSQSQLRLLHRHTGSAIHSEPPILVEPYVSNVSMPDISRCGDVAQAPHPSQQSALRNPQFAIRNPQSLDRRSRSSSILKKGFSLGGQLELSVIFFLAPWLVWTVMQYINQSHLEIYPYRSSFQGYISAVGSFLNDFGVIFFLKTLLLNLYRCFLGGMANLILPGIDIGNAPYLNFVKDYLLYGGISILSAFLSFTVIFTCIKDILKKKISIISIYIAFLFIIILLWPVEPDRFLIPVMPFIFLFFLNGISTLLQKGNNSGLYRHSDMPVSIRHDDRHALQKAYAPILFVFLFIVILNAGIAITHNIVQIVNARRSEEWREKEGLFRWIRENTQNKDILACMVSPSFYLYTGRKAIPPIVNMDLNDVSQPIQDSMVIENFRNLLDYTYDKNVYMIKTNYPYPQIYEHMIDRLAIKYPSMVSLRYVGKDLRYSIYALK